jgi:hypothetical protein
VKIHYNNFSLLHNYKGGKKMNGWEILGMTIIILGFLALVRISLSGVIDKKEKREEKREEEREEEENDETLPKM